MGELQAFLNGRLAELTNDQEVMPTLTGAPDNVQVSEQRLHELLRPVDTLLNLLTSTRTTDLLLIRSSSRHVSRLVKRLKDLLDSADKQTSLAGLMVIRREEAFQEQAKTEPQVDILSNATQILKQ